MLRRLLPLVRDRPFGGRHAHAQARKPSRFLVHAQPVFLLLGHDRSHKSYHKSALARPIHVTKASPPHRAIVSSLSHPIPPALRPKPRNVTLPKHDSRPDRHISRRGEVAVANYAVCTRGAARLHVAVPAH